MIVKKTNNEIIQIEFMEYIEKLYFGLEIRDYFG